ncbi:catalase [Rheinheimera soli]|uniref:Catalase n=1 Tax=Rheinheimera soli TaxID=443616 RepID=A0ABU1W4U5_9GAMM|nr:catalase [Rheinheimera soli]MDR7122984.1 catalase [Rheinheimera soli]
MTKNKKPDKSSQLKNKDALSIATAPAHQAVLKTNDIVAEQASATDSLVSSQPYNSNKALEYGHDNALTPPPGATAVPRSITLTASTATEDTGTTKTGSAVRPGTNPTVASLNRVRVDASDRPLTTNQGVRISDNQNSLKAGLRGPSLLEDFILREKITHFDHERIPERIVHARGSGAHGYFKAYDALGKYTSAAPFAEEGKITPVFVRFSTVAGERGSKDTARDVRGFAVKFYSDEGNWDLVGNNMPVFFIQDAMKFPDLVHAVKPEPHHGMPQAASAHDTFWDFVSLMPESTHMLMWLMSDRALPRSYRMMQGFGVHTFRLVNEQGQSIFCKFHWKPLQGTHALLWDEAVKISGADPDFHRRDLWEAIESGEFPEWELGLQLFTEEQAAGFSFDVLDATKLIPEELVPVLPVGLMVLNRNPDNFFAETEQVAFCTAHVIPGIDFSNDPLLAGRIHSYVDTQISRLGGANFHEIPINSPLASVQNNQRDGMHRQALNRGRVAYEPNSLAGGCPFQAGASQSAVSQAGNGGFMPFPDRVSEDKVRGKPEKFAEHYLQATLFFNSQTAVEKAHITDAFRFELSKVAVPAIRSRMLSSLVNVCPELAAEVAAGLGMDLPDAMPKAILEPQLPEVTVSAALSMMALPGECGVRTRQVAILIEEGIQYSSLLRLYDALTEAGAVVHFVGPRIGIFTCASGEKVEADRSLENSPAVLFDAAVLPDGNEAIRALATNKHTLGFIKDLYQHCKTILALGDGRELLDRAGVGPGVEENEGILMADNSSLAAIVPEFIHAVAAHRHPSRDPATKDPASK